MNADGRMGLDFLGESTAEAVERALQNASPGAARVGAVVAGHGAEQAGEQAVHGLAVPAVCAEVSYVDGVTGGNVFLLPVEGARRLAASMMGEEGSAGAEGAELTELELSAVGEAMNQMMSAAALATSSVLGQEVEIAPPQIRVVTTEAEAAEILRASAAPHVLTVNFTVAHVSARLVQLVPNAFVVRMERAREAQTTEYTTAPLGAALRAVPVRVWAELGRARMPAGTSLDLPTGSVVELDREVEDPVDLYVDGLHFATGRLRVAEDGSLQLEVEQVLGLQHGAGAVAQLEAPPAPALADEPEMADPEMAEPEPEVAEAVTLEAEEVPQAEPESPTESKEV
jgi:flagellar motor switch protein FliN/FliY